MKIKLRKKVYNKYNKHCAYCGKEIDYSDMQVDHIFPKNREHFLKSEPMKIMEGLTINNIDDFENLNPSCRMCNHYKRALTLEHFRDQIKTLHERIEKIYINRVGLDYGVIIIKPFDGIFYFEKVDTK